MVGFDLAVGLDIAALTDATAAVYRDLYPRAFTGARHVEKSGVGFDVSWNVRPRRGSCSARRPTAGSW